MARHLVRWKIKTSVAAGRHVLVLVVYYAGSFSDMSCPSGTVGWQLLELLQVQLEVAQCIVVCSPSSHHLKNTNVKEGKNQEPHTKPFFDILV